MMSSPVMAEYYRQLERVNRESSFYARGEYTQDLQNARARVAAALGADINEIALSRGATEALQCLIGGYNRLKPGDAVIYADLDYPAMQYAMNWLADRRGVRIVRIAIPEPATRDNVLGAYRAALDANPDVRLLLLTHVNNKTGLILPVATITEFARRRNVEVIVDAAHSWGQLDLSVADVGADFIGFNLHKWVGAPIGVGVIYIRKGRLNDIDRMMADEDQPADSILSRVHTGTMNFAAVLAVPAALDFHVSVGPAYKAARLRYLRDRWVNAVRGLPGLEILTPDDPDMAAAITSFRIRGRTSRADNDQLVDALLKQHGLFTVRRTGIEQGDCVRVTPALYNRPEDVDRLAQALKQLSRQGR
jgi:selenocysteine lyase/cysteine desulfurase